MVALYRGALREYPAFLYPNVKLQCIVSLFQYALNARPYAFPMGDLFAFLFVFLDFMPYFCGAVFATVLYRFVTSDIGRGITVPEPTLWWAFFISV